MARTRTVPTPVKRLSLLVLLCAVLPAPSSLATVPSAVSFQGLLLDDTGQPINGAVDLDFALFATLVGGTALWTESHTGVPVTDGVYEVALGSQVPLTAAIFAGGSAFLEISVDSEVLTPRQQLQSVPYALRSQTTENVGALPDTAILQLWETADSDGNGLRNDDAIEGLVDIDGDGLANFADSDNDGDGVSDTGELGAGDDPNLVTPRIGSLTPSTAPGDQSTLVVVDASFPDTFEPGFAVTFDGAPITPQNVTTSQFEVTVGPVAVQGAVTLVVTNPNGEIDSEDFTFTFDPPDIVIANPSVARFDLTTRVLLTGTDFEPGITVVFGSETPTALNVTPTSFEVDVGPQPIGPVTITVTNPSGGTDDHPFTFVEASAERPAFVTSTVHDGNLGGLAGADAICAARAAAAGLPGTFLAWLGAFPDFPAARFTVPGGYSRTDQVEIAADLPDLFDGMLAAPLQVDEFGNTIGPEFVWTGVNASGTLSPFRCNEWTDNSSGTMGRFGEAFDQDFTWSTAGQAGCDSLHHLYCFQQ